MSKPRKPLTEEKYDQKRREHNVKKLVSFALTKDKYDCTKVCMFDAFTPDEALKFMRLYLDRPWAIDGLMRYARLHKQAVGELSAGDFKRAKKLAQDISTVAEVMDS